MIFSNIKYKRFKILFLFSLFFAISVNAQKQLQKIGFVDIEYVLNNIPSYIEAQKKLDSETTTWKNNLDKMYLKLENMKEEFLNEEPLLTEDLIKERELEIKDYEDEIINTENTYFATEGKLFELRKQLVTPYQDLVFNAIQTIAKTRKYDMVFDKSASMSMLYTNNNYDISKLVLKYITKSTKEIEQEEAAIKRQIAKEAREKRIEEQKKKREEARRKKEEERLQKNKQTTKVESDEEVENKDEIKVEESNE